LQFKKIIWISLLSVIASIIFPANSFALDVSKIDINSSELITTDNSSGILNVYLNTFKPNDYISFQVTLNNPAATTLGTGSGTLSIPIDGSFQFSLQAGSTLAESSIGQPIKTITDSTGSPLIQVYPTPPDFPKLTFSGDTHLIANRQILATPVEKNGSYAVAYRGDQVQYFVKSASNLIGFRRINDSKPDPSAGGTPVYAYLEQKNFGVTATSPGTWRLLDDGFDTVARINDVTTKYGDLFGEGHGMTTSPAGNAVVITTPVRQVDSTWLKRQYKLPILDCDIAEVDAGNAIREFSFWDWAVAHKSISEPLLDAMPLFNDPQNPTSSPIDICHANSMQYYKPLNVYLFSLRSPSILLEVATDLKTVKAIIPTDSSLQHYARFWSPSEITALGNYTFAKASKFLDFKLVNGAWKLTEYNFPVHVEYCGTTNYIDNSHIWLSGGCGSFLPGVMGAIYSISGSNLVEVGEVKASPFIYTYRADIL
jgi:hypothetical protein